MIQRNLLNCYKWNACFCFTRPPILASKIHPKNMFFQDAFLQTLFCDCMLNLCENGRCWDPFEIKWAPKWNPQTTKWRPKPQFSNFMGGPPDLLMHLPHPLAHFWYPFGSNRQPFLSLLVSFPMFFRAFTFKPNAGPTSLWLFVSVCSARFRCCGVCQCRYVLKT